MHLNNISHKYIRLLAFMGRQAAERSTVVATAADMAQTIFDRIASGAGNAVGRPAVIDKSNSTIDRALRELVEQANRNGDCIINAGEGYFRPIPGNVEAKTTANYGDDGVSQKTTIKQGIASKADVLVPNPVTLVPYRTFLEVKQPDSEFVFRIRDNGGAPAFKIVEAEGGLWRNLAVISIKEYLMEALKDDPNYGRLTFIA